MKKLCFYSLIALMCCVSTTVRAYEITVGNGTNTNYKIPFAPGSANSYQRMQFIYEASSLSAMNGSSIYQMTFYTSNEIATNWGGASFKVSLAEVEATDFGTVDNDAAFNDATLTQVYSGGFSVYGDELVIEFDNSYAYGGGNLLLEVILTWPGTNTSAYFYGTNTEAAGAIHGVIGSSSIYSNITTVDKYGGKQRFSPKTTFAYGTKSSCAKPTGLIAYNVTNNSAKIGWSTEELVSYTLEYKKIGKYNKWTVIENASNGTTLSDLDEYSTYLARLKKDCGEEVSQYATTSFFTPCAPKTAEELPYEYGFEDVSTGDIPACWYKIANGNYPAVQKTSANGTAYEGDYYLYLYGGTPATNCIVILPTIDAPYSELALSFWYKNGSIGESYGKAQIGYMTNRNYASTFVSIQDLDQVTEYTHVENVSLADIPSNAYLAIRIGGATYSSQLFLDNVVISSSTPTCGKPSGLKASDIKDVSASITWDKGAATSSVLEYKLSDAESWTVVENAVSPYALSGLTASSTYDVRVKNNCDEIGESGYVTTQFTTLCEIFQADSENPFSENFEEVASGKLPDCWDNSEEGPGFGLPWNLTSLGHSAITSISFPIYTSCDEGYYNVLKTKQIHINSDATLSFYWKNPIGANLEIWYSIEDGEPVKLDDSFTKDENWNQFVKALPAECTKKNVRLLFKGIVPAGITNSGYLTIDDILIECEETCPKPNITTVGVSGGSVEVEWNKGGEETEWLYICQPKSVELVNWESAKTSTSTLVYVDGLEPLTDYVFYLRAKCSEDDQSGVVTSEFKTECGGAYKSYTTGFEASEGFVLGTYPECWTKMYVSGSEPEIDPVIATEGEGENVNQYLRVHGTGRQLIILPPFDKEIKDLQISFKYKLENNFNDLYVSFGTMSDLGGTDRFKALSQQPTYTSNTAEYQSLENFSLSTARSGDYYFAFFIQNPGGGRKPIFYLDNLVVEPVPVVPTAVENVETEVSAQKLMIDGQLYILHNGKIYTMQGQRVK